MEAHLLVVAASRIGLAPIADAWKFMAQAIVMYCPEEQFATFDAIHSKITFTVEDIRSIITSDR